MIPTHKYSDTFDFYESEFFVEDGEGMNNDEKALQAATEIMDLVSKYAITSQLKAKIQLVITKALNDPDDWFLTSPQHVDNHLLKLAEEAGGCRIADNLVQMTAEDIERVIYFVKEGY